MGRYGFLKLRCDMLLQPDMAYMYSEEGATGLGLYVAINLYLYQCDGGWGRYTNHMLSVIAYENHRRRSDVRRMIECYGLFIIEGDRFSSHWMQKQLCKTASSMHENGITPARSYNTGAGNRVIENKKEKKKKCVCLEDTHTTFSDTPRPLSEFETVRDGRRYASHGQPLPDDAPPQRHRNWYYSLQRREWVTAEEYLEERRHDIKDHDNEDD